MTLFRLMVGGILYTAAALLFLGAALAVSSEFAAAAFLYSCESLTAEEAMAEIAQALQKERDG